MKKLIPLAFLFSCNSELTKVESPIPIDTIHTVFDTAHTLMALSQNVSLQVFRDTINKINARYINAISLLQKDMAVKKAETLKFAADTLLNSKSRNSTLLSIKNIKDNLTGLYLSIGIVEDTMIQRTTTISFDLQKYKDSAYNLYRPDYIIDSVNKTLKIKR